MKLFVCHVKLTNSLVFFTFEDTLNVWKEEEGWGGNTPLPLGPKAVHFSRAICSRSAASFFQDSIKALDFTCERRRQGKGLVGPCIRTQEARSLLYLKPGSHGPKFTVFSFVKQARVHNLRFGTPSKGIGLRKRPGTKLRGWGTEPEVRHPPTFTFGG